MQAMETQQVESDSPQSVWSKLQLLRNLLGIQGGWFYPDHTNYPRIDPGNKYLCLYHCTVVNNQALLKHVQVGEVLHRLVIHWEEQTVEIMRCPFWCMHYKPGSQPEEAEINVCLFCKRNTTILYSVRAIKRCLTSYDVYCSADCLIQATIKWGIYEGLRTPDTHVLKWTDENKWILM